MDFNFKNKVVLITGSSSGIGRGAAMAFADKGAKVVLSSRNIVENKKLLDDIVRLGGNAILVRTDLSNDRDVKQMVDKAMMHYGRIDIAINSAGIEGTPGIKTANYNEKVWDDVLDVNLKGIWLSMKYEIQAMLVGGYNGNIINIASLAGLKGGDEGVAYHASKFGVVGLTKSTALEYAKESIRVNTICPAVIETPMAERAFHDEDKRKTAISMHPVMRFGKIHEVISAIFWLASEHSAFVTGAAIPVDGGASI